MDAAPLALRDYVKYHPNAWANYLTRRTATGAPYVNYPMVSNDVSYFPGTKGYPTQHFSALVIWNPSGQAQESAGNTTGLSPAITVFAVSGSQTDGMFAPYSRVLGGIQFNFGSATTPTNNGFFRFAMSLPENSALSIPAGDGYLAYVRPQNAGTGTIEPMPAGGTAQWAQRPQAGPDDPAYPGTNPSNSDANIWEDFNATLAWAWGNVDPLANEVRNYDVLPAASTLPGRRQPAVLMAYDSNAFYASMTVDRDCQDSEDTWLPFKWIAVDGSDVPVMDGSNFVTSVVESEPEASGVIHMIHPRRTAATVVQHRYQLYIKPTGYLAVLTEGFDMTTSGVNLGTIVFKGGDIDNDNEVGGNDLSILSGAFLAVAGDPNFVAAADIDGDGEVGSSDLSCLSANFLESGDVDPLGCH